MADHTTTRADGTTVVLGGEWGDQAAADETAGLVFDPTAKADVSLVFEDIPQIAHNPQQAVIQEATASISMLPATATIDVSDASTQQLAVTNAAGDDVTADATYVSSDPTKATVSAAGLVSPVAAGSATITATYAGKTDTTVVTVTA